MKVHTSGPSEGDVTVLTSEPGIAAVLAGRFPAAVALERGLIALDGDAARRDAMQRLLLAALDPTSSSPAAAGTRSAPVQLFGPAR